jgi:hypothetical protein
LTGQCIKHIVFCVFLVTILLSQIFVTIVTIVKKHFDLIFYFDL